MRSLPVLLSLAALIVACTKSETTDNKPTGSASAPLASASAAPTASASASAATTASAEPSASAAASASAAPTEKAGADAGKTTAAGSASAGGGGNASGAGECGTKPLPDCPLQAWMKTHMNPPSMAGDGPALATALDQAAAFAPPGYTNWASIAKDGAKAAKGGDVTAAKASCRSCHDQYKKKYQAEFRTKKI